MVCTVRVLYADTDQMGVANHAVALRWFEQARAEWLRLRGRTYRQVEEEGTLLPVYEVRVRYLRPVRYDDLLELHAHIDPPTTVRVVFHYKVVRQHDQAVMVTGSTHHACVGPDGRPRRCPPDLLQLLQAHAVSHAPAAASVGEPTEHE